MDSGLPSSGVKRSKEQLLWTTLRNVHAQGHPYVELRREEGKKLIFFCTLCFAQCYSDSNLYDHLRGHQHSVRLASAQVTLLKPNPWPFNDGQFFFHIDSEDQNKSVPASECEQNMLLDTHHTDADSLALVGPVSSAQSPHHSEDNADCDETPSDSGLEGVGTGQILVLPGVLQKDEISDLVVRHIGVGKICARLCDKDGVSTKIFRMWCEWLGKDVDYTNEDFNVIPEQDFAIVTFSFNYNLGRKGFDVRYLLPSSPHSESLDTGCSKGKKRKSISDQEDTSETLRNQDNYSGEESRSTIISKSKALFSGSDDQQVGSRISKKTMRKLQRKHELVASDRICDLCRQKMLPNKDVAALMNRTTGKLVCSSRNFTGAFHVYHVSCLVLWILHLEVETFEKNSLDPKVKRRCRNKAKGKNVQKQEEQICTVFCPECQGTGITIDGADLEIPTVSLNEVFWKKIKLHAARNAWVKSPELVENCSMGFYFPLDAVETYKESVSPLKLLHFYRADDFGAEAEASFDH